MNKSYFNVFKPCYTGRQLVIGENPDGLLPAKEVLANVMNAGFRNEINMPFFDPKTKIQYYYEFDEGTTDEIVIMRVANRRVRTQADPHHGVKYVVDHPYLYVIINTMDENDHVVMIEQYPGVYQAVDEVVRVLKHSLGLLTYEKGWKLELVPHETNKVQDLGMMAVCSAIERRLGKERTIENLYGHEEARKRIYLGKTENIVATSSPKKSSRKSNKTLRSAILDIKKADMIEEKINNCLVGKTEPEDEMIPITAAYAAKVMRRPKWTELKNSHPELRLSESSFYRLRDPNCLAYRGDTVFLGLVEYFKSL